MEPVASSDVRERFARIAQTPDSRIDLADAALVIAAEEYPTLDVQAELARLDELAGRARETLDGAASLRERVERLNCFLFEKEGFTGNREEYYDPRNSFLNEVLERHCGIPIALSVVYMEVARRAGLDAHGICFPGHFLLKVVGGDEEIVVDAFFQKILGFEECEARLHDIHGEEACFDARVHLRAATHREILVRMLSNLKHVHLHARDFERTLACCERILLLIPDAPIELRDRGAVYEQLECYAAAIEDLERFLALAPDDETAPAVRAKVVSLRGLAPTLQ